MKTKHLAFLLTFILLVNCGFTRRISGKQRFKSRSSRSKSDLVGSKIVESQVDFGRNWVFYIIPIGLFILLCFIYLRFLRKLSFRKDRAEELKKITDEFEQRYPTSFNELNENQRMDKIDNLMTKKWKINYANLKGEITHFLQAEMTNIIKQADFIFEFDSEGTEKQLGDFSLKGIILFHKNKISMCFDKLHWGNSKRGQFHSQKVLIHECEQQGDNFFKGKWYYDRSQKDSESIGTIQMILD